MRPRVIVVAISAAVFVLAAPVNFVVQTVLADRLPASTMTAVLALGVFVFATAVVGLPRRGELAGLGGRGIIEAVLAGILGVFLPQFLVLAHRYSDAPPGTEVIFFTTACWGVLVLVASLALRKRPTVGQFAAAGVALFGTAAVLANWERPSSFSPFVRYPTDEVWMLVAGASWAAFSVLVARLARKNRLRAFVPLATGVAALLAILVALSGGEGASGLGAWSTDMWLHLLIATSTLSAMILSWMWLARDAGPAASSALMFLPAVMLSVLGVFERKAALLGPSPLLWRAVAWGCVATVAGATAVTMSARAGARARGRADGRAAATPDSDASKMPAREGRLFALGSAGLAAAAVVSAVVTLWAPALSASVAGTLDTGGRYAASWTMVGAETPAGWLTFLTSVFALVAAVNLVRHVWTSPRAAAAAVCAVAAIGATPALLYTPLRTWTRWIPTDIQHAYGTEYARLTLARAWGPSLTVALALAGAASAVLIVGWAITAGRGRLRSGTPGDSSSHRDQADQQATPREGSA